MREILSKRLTPSQRDAITHEGPPLILVAGPGTGKTDTLVRRAAWLIQEHGIEPERLLITTFTHKATLELIHRLREFIGRDALRTTISTIHSFCQQALQDYADRHPWGPGFRVMDDREQFLFIYARLRELGLKQFPKGRPGDFISNVQRFYNLCTEEQVEPDELQNLINEKGAELLDLKKPKPEAAEEYQAVAASYPIYCRLIRREKLMDFAHLQSVFYDLLANDPDVRAIYNERFDHLLVDEYQDTNRLQVLLLQKLMGPETGITAVGDDDQSIYRFRGASVESFLDFEKDFQNARKIPLDDNFRSRQPIVTAATTLIRENSQRRDKDLKASRPEAAEGVPPIIIQAETVAEEAERVVNALETWISDGVIKNYSDVAMLFRSVKNHATEYMDQMEDRKIPFTIRSDGRFFERQDVYSLRELIKFFSWKRKWEAGCLEGKVLELEPATIQAIKDWKGKPREWSDERILEELGIKNDHDKRVLKGIGELRTKSTGDGLGDLMNFFYRLLEVSGYFERNCEGADDKECEAALLNLGQFSTLMESFTRHMHGERGSLNRFLKYLYDLPRRSLDNLKPDDVDRNAVQVITVHQAKGLEFPVVIIGSAMKNRFPGSFRRTKYPVPSELRLSKLEETREQHEMDERRLFYVAMTRAKDLLVIGAPEKVNTRGGGISPFVKELGKENRLQLDENGTQMSDLPNVQEAGVESEPKRLSWTALHTYMLCPLKYKLLNECQFRTGYHLHQEMGHTLHRCLELIHRRARAGDIPTPDEADKIYKRVAEPVDSDTSEPNEESRQKKQLRTMSIRAIRQYLQHYTERLHRVEAMEEPLEYPIGDHITLHGRLDLLCRSDNGDGYEIYDFKMRKREGMDVLKPQIQTQAYSLALEEAGRKIRRVRLHLMFEDEGKEVFDVEWDDESQTRVKNQLLDAAGGILEEIFDPTPGNHCQFCHFQNICPASEYRETNNDQPLNLDTYE